MELVMVADVEHHAIEGEDAIDETRQIADEPFGVLVEHELLA